MIEHKKFRNLIVVASDMMPYLHQASKKHFSFILSGSAILAVGINNPYRTHPLSRRYGTIMDGVHSELAAFIKVRHIADLSKCSLVNLRLSWKDVKNVKNRPIVISQSKPCCKCLPWVTDVFGRIFYSTSKGFEEL